MTYAMAPIEAYVSAWSAYPGDTLDFKVRCASATSTSVHCTIRKKGGSDTLVFDDTFVVSPQPDPPADAYATGCGWSRSFSVDVASRWTTGIYQAIVADAQDPDNFAQVFFVVKTKYAGYKSSTTAPRVLVVVPLATHAAYNSWGGGSLYGLHDTSGVYHAEDSDHPGRATFVSFDRPFGIGFLYDIECAFAAWFETFGLSESLGFDYCTSLDLDGDGVDLARYQLVLSLGHDEYWSQSMRNKVEAFVLGGGNAAFFSGNLCWWQVRFENGGVTCFKYRGPPPWDPETAPTDDAPSDPSTTTVYWFGKPVSRPETRMVGATWYYGGVNAEARAGIGYSVKFPEHWVFNGTGLGPGSVFGAGATDPADASNIIGYECDGVDYEEFSGVPRATGARDTPRNYVILGLADLSDWGAGAPNGFGQIPRATMGVFRNGGTVFNAGTIFWYRGLSSTAGPPNTVDRITMNVLNRLAYPDASSPRLANLSFENPPASSWYLESAGAGSWARVVGGRGGWALKIDATKAQTWASQGFYGEGRGSYLFGGWVNCSLAKASIRLQRTDTFEDLGVASCQGTGGWEWVSAVARIEDRPVFPCRIKLQTEAGAVALFDEIFLRAL